MEIREEYIQWIRDNLGDKAGIWYSPYLEQLGHYLKLYFQKEGYKQDFFGYTNYNDFKKIYKSITGEDDEALSTILLGSSKKYPVEYRNEFGRFRYIHAEHLYNQGLWRNPRDVGGIASLGPILRSYLKFLYYKDHPELTYPKKRTKVADDFTLNYWVIQTDKEGLFVKNNFIGIPWDYLGDLSAYESRDDMQQEIKDHEKIKHNPWNSSLATWEFANEMSIGDIIYLKNGVQKIIAKGEVLSDYQYDSDGEYKHIRQVKWLMTGDWKLGWPITSKLLTNFTKYPDWVESTEKIIAGTYNIEREQVENFREWLLSQVNGENSDMTEETVQAQVAALTDFEKDFNVKIFGEQNVESLKEIRSLVIQKNKDNQYDKHTAHIKTSFDSYINYVDTRTPIAPGNDLYSDDDFLTDVFMSLQDLTRLKSILQHKKNLIFKGAPGVGKTYVADRLAYTMMGEVDKNRIHFVQFHQSYSYEDFIEGYRPNEETKGFTLAKGPFIRFCDRARQDPERPYFFIIDEINRGNMSKIFGELMMLIEADKRDKSLNLLYSNRAFSVPSNVYIIGTMNTADRSLGALDYALRRRFSFYELKPAFKHPSFHTYVKTYENTELLVSFIEQIVRLNQSITQSLGSGFEIGHSYFTDEAISENTRERLEEILEYEIIPQLEEYWFDDQDKVDQEAAKLRGILHETVEYTD